MDAEQYLAEIPLWTRKKNTLADVRHFLAEMGNPDDNMQIIHVAGTNGKGSVCAYLSSELVRAGYRTGLFISPHLVTIRERIQTDGQMIGQEEFQETFEKVHQLVCKMIAMGYQHPSFFEYLFLMAMFYYRDNPVDYLVLETGMGGLLDTTNVIRHPVLTVITSISLEHTRYLGDTVEAIAGQKAGITKPGSPLVYDAGDEEANAVFAGQAKNLQIPVYPVAKPGREQQKGFCASYQAMNAAVACQALQLLSLPGWDAQAAFERMKSVVWSGRMEEILPDVWVDGAHNEGGIQAFTEAAKEISQRTGKQIRLLFACVADKNYNHMIRLLCEQLTMKSVIITRLDSERTSRISDLEQEFCRCRPEMPVRGYADVKQALKEALSQKTEEELLFVAGSLYLIGEIKAALGGTGYV